jgi:hypothetical protein
LNKLFTVYLEIDPRDPVNLDLVVVGMAKRLKNENVPAIS